MRLQRSAGRWGEDLGSYCALTPDLLDTNHAFVVATMNSNNSTASTQMARCYINDNASVVCQRDRGAASGLIEYQVVELPYGLRVQEQLFPCSTPPITRTFSAVDAGASFVLRSNKGSGSTLDDDDLVVARLVSPTQVEVDWGTAGGGCNGGDFGVQLVQFDGVSVTRGVFAAGLPIGQVTASEVQLSPVGPNTVVLTQARPRNGSLLCTELVRADMPSPTSITFTRGNGAGASCAGDQVLSVEWQRIDFGARATVQVRQVAIAASSVTGAATLMPVDPSRTVAFTSAMVSGPGGGETDYTGTYFAGEGMARVQLTSPTTVTLSRAHASGAASFTVYVVQLEP
ncbi:MAG: hypothetical protein IPJ65_21360 [Archangiaceae bacterium]|nr:hypothetical protein [Archangiaceae bacterium]